MIKGMELKKILRNLLGLLFAASLIYVAACDDKASEPTQTPPSGPNPYGDGNGKITFIRRQPIDGPVIVNISNDQFNDSIIWQSVPPCDTNIAASKILRAGNYTVSIEGAVFLCHYDITVQERVCKILDYTDCAGGYVGCSDITGIWYRTEDGPCPNCKGLKVEFRNGFGEVIYTPAGCRFPIGDIKWKDFDLGSCIMQDLARDQYGGSPQYMSSSLTFSNKNFFVINDVSGVIPYSKIAPENGKKTTENTDHDRSIIAPVDSLGLQLAK